MKYITLILLLAISTVIQADGLGRLFFTPEQRVQLEREHAHNTASGEDSSSVMMVNGIVQKQGGSRTVWINGVAQRAGNSDAQTPDSLPVAIPGQSKSVKVKVGQKLLLDNKPAPKKPAAPSEPEDDD